MSKDVIKADADYAVLHIKLDMQCTFHVLWSRITTQDDGFLIDSEIPRNNLRAITRYRAH